tara:strand:+ start:5758 stop:6288 length:531 start_codon:yes stop_codon:yes gene_type:complete
MPSNLLAGKKHDDSRVTVRCLDDRGEYNRQLYHIKTKPKCKEIPAPRSYKSKDPRITVKCKDNYNEYSRQTNYIRKHPDCKEVPPKNSKRHHDPRVTVLNSEDSQEYKRQTNYIHRHPDCIEVPPRAKRVWSVASLKEENDMLKKQLEDLNKENKTLKWKLKMASSVIKRIRKLVK